MKDMSSIYAESSGNEITYDPTARTYDKVDHITLKDAFENPVPWMMIWAGEPNRQISVQMSYTDLKVITDLIRKAKAEAMAEIEEEKYRKLEKEIER
jgi:hypothetical protein